MKRSPHLLLGLAALLLIAVPAMAGGEHAGSWFDLENCGMCKNLSAEPGMLENIGWEHHLVENGMLTITVVPDDQKQAWGRAMKGMEKAQKALQAGEQMHMCGFCMSMGAIMMSGKAKVEEMETIGGSIMLVTSSDPATVEKIHAHGKRTLEEMKTMQLEESSGAE